MQVHQPGDHVEFIVELTYGSVVRVCQARVALGPSDGVLHAHPGGVDQVAVFLLLGSQDPVALGSLAGDHERSAGQILVGSLIAPVDPDADPSSSGVEPSRMDSAHLPNGIGSSLSSVMSPVEPTGAARYPDYHPAGVGIDVGVVGEPLPLSRVYHAPDGLL